MEASTMEVFGSVILNWLFGTLGGYIAVVMVIVGVMTITLGGLKTFNALMSRTTVELAKAKGNVAELMQEVKQ